MLPNFLSYGAMRQEEGKLQNLVPHCQDAESRNFKAKSTETSRLSTKQLTHPNIF